MFSKKRYTNKLSALALFAVVLLLSGCSSLQQLLIDVVTPELTVVGNPYIVNAELPNLLLGGNVVVRVPIEAYNPNVVGIELTKVDLGLFLNTGFVANGVFEERQAVAINGRSRFDVDVNLPVLNVIASAPAISDLFFGNPTRVTVDAIVTIDVLNTIKVSAKTDIFNEVVNQ